MKRLFRWQTLVCLFIGVLVASCAMDQRFEIPGVPGGDPTPGDPGENGKSAYELWLEQLRNGDITNICTGEPWDDESDELMDFFEWLRGCNGTNGKDGADGADGDDGVDGKDGDTPYIGPDGDWWIGDTDTDVPAQGKDGENGDDGEDGDTPRIGPDGDWWIGDKDTDVPARGQQGAPGKDGTPGASAYDLWLFQLRNGAIKDCDGNNWPQTADGMTNFVMWLKGCKGDKGEPGENGLSAYQMWLKWVADGLVFTCDGDGKTTKWPTGSTEPTNFIDWLKGCDGANGTNGTNGTDGKSAHALWIDMVIAGKIFTCDGDGVTNRWRDDEIGLEHFTEWLKGCTGENGGTGTPGAPGEKGQSAYEMWKDRLENSELYARCDGTVWPKAKNSENDFFEWLRGCDGEPGTDGRPGLPGEPGGVTTIVKDKYNVVTEYFLQSASEYVNPNDGSVIFQVYDKESNKVDEAGWLVDMSALGVSGGPLPTDANGVVRVTKDLLPRSGTVEERHGSVLVKSLEPGAVYEASAETTYVPQKIAIELRMVSTNQHPILSELKMNFMLMHARRVVSEGDWEPMPTYFEQKAQDLNVYRLKDPTGSATDKNNLETYIDYQAFTINRHGVTYPAIWRNVNRGDYVADSYYAPDGKYNNNGGAFSTNMPMPWSGTYHRYVFESNGLYGESDILDEPYQEAPVQYIPMLKSLSVAGYATDTNSFSYAKGEWDLTTVDYNLLFEKTATLVDGVWTWAKMDEAKVKALDVLDIIFMDSGEGSQGEASPTTYATLNDPTFEIRGRSVYVGSTVHVTARSTASGSVTDATNYTFLFRRPYVTYFGVLRQKTGTSGYILEKGAPHFNFNPIDVTVLPAIPQP